MREGTAEVPHPIAAAHLPEAAAVFDAATALAPAKDRVAPQPTLVALLGRHVLLLRALLPQIEINSNVPQRAEERENHGTPGSVLALLISGDGEGGR